MARKSSTNIILDEIREVKKEQKEQGKTLAANTASLAANTATLEVHVKRTDLLEKKVDGFLVKTLMVVSGVLTILWTASRLLEKL